MNPHRISFARTLPILALLLSYVIIAVPATMIYVNLKLATRNGQDAVLQTHLFRAVIPHDHVLQYSLTLATVSGSRTIQSINLPAHLIERAIAEAAQGRSARWSPFHWNYLVWFAFAFPVFCVPFWWLVGVGLDGVFGRRLRWWFLGPSVILWVFFLIGLSAFYFAFSPLERTEIVYPIWSVWLWFTLLSVFPIALVKQTLARRRTKRILHTRLSTELQ